VSDHDEGKQPPRIPQLDGSGHPAGQDEALALRLAHLKETLQVAKGDAKEAVSSRHSGGDGSGRAVATGMRAAADLVAGTLTGAAVGFFADRWLSTRPVFLIVFLMIGIAAGFRNLYRLGMRPTTVSAEANSTGVPGATGAGNRSARGSRPDEGAD